MRGRRRFVAQISTCSEDVVVLAGSVASVVHGFAEVESIADAAAVVDREYDVAVAGQVLVHRIGVGVVLHGMKAEQHLTARSAVEEDEGGCRLPSWRWRAEELSVEFEAIGGREEHLFGRDEVRSRVG